LFSPPRPAFSPLAAGRASCGAAGLVRRDRAACAYCRRRAAAAVDLRGAAGRRCAALAAIVGIAAISATADAFIDETLKRADRRHGPNTFCIEEPRLRCARRRIGLFDSRTRPLLFSPPSRRRWARRSHCVRRTLCALLLLAGVSTRPLSDACRDQPDRYCAHR